MRLTPLILLFTTAAFTASAARVCEVRTFGAKGDGQAKDTAAFQAAIEACAKGGGTVLVAPGTYRLTPISLKSHVTLELAKGAVLAGSTDLSDYPNAGEITYQGKVEKRPASLVSAAGQSDVGIRGEGTIDGSGEVWWRAFRERSAAHEDLPRPWLVQFRECSHVTVEGVTLKDSPSKTLVAYLSSDVAIRRVHVLAPSDSPNTDGIVAYSSHRVRIENCTVDTGSDNIIVVSSRAEQPGQDWSSSDITVSDCTLLHGHGASIGSDTGGGVHHVVMEHLHLNGTSNGLRIKTGRGFGGEVSDIVYRYIDMIGVTPAIAITAYYPSVPKVDTPVPISATTPRFHDILLEHVTSTGGQDAGYILGLPESPIPNVTLDDVKISAVKGLRLRNTTVTVHNSTVEAAQGPAFIAEDHAQIVRQ